MNLSVRNLSIYHNKTKIINNFSCTCKPGTVTAIYGDNATGKTTLLSTIAGIHNNYSGQIKHTHVALGQAMDTPILFEQYTAREHFIYIHKLHNKQINTDFWNIFELEPFKKTKTHNLSHGNRQKLSLVCSVIANPTLILRDEPCNGLDKKSRQTVTACLQEYKKQQKTIILTTHISEDIEKTIDQKIYL